MAHLVKRLSTVTYCVKDRQRPIKLSFVGYWYNLSDITAVQMDDREGFYIGILGEGHITSVLSRP